MRKFLLSLFTAALLASCVTTEADRQALQKGFASYTSREFDEAEAAASKFIDANPNSPNIDEAYYLRGISKLTRGGSTNRAAAAVDLRLAAQKSNRADLKAKTARVLARIDGDTHFDAARWKEARESYQQALPGATPADATYFNYRIGACLQAAGDWEAAQPCFQNVVAANADHFLTERAISRMYARNFSLQFGAFQEGARAAEVRTQLRTSGITAEVVTETREGKLIYIVRTGAYKTWQEADAARERLQARYPLVAIVP